jgi:hypothetical protein
MEQARLQAKEEERRRVEEERLKVGGGHMSSFHPAHNIFLPISHPHSHLRDLSLTPTLLQAEEEERIRQEEEAKRLAAEAKKKKKEAAKKK